ncbi:MAG: hypothetical protein RQ966_12930 [Acetobacteraceae bacterium]|nr:hypothetical protein [Acetobacteraceae bacterium]
MSGSEPPPDPPPDWDEARLAEIAAALTESEAQVAAGQTVPLAPLLRELQDLADEVAARQQAATTLDR